MIVKPRSVPIRIKQNLALLRRLPKDHRKRPLIEEDQVKRNAGYRGEQSIDYHLGFLSVNEYQILHDIRLQTQSHFQIDTLLISPKYLLIIEVKNISGTLFFDKPSNQLIRTVNGIEEGFPNPLNQVKRQRLQLQQWMEKHKLTNVPIEYLVVISQNSTILKTSVGHHSIFNRLIHAELLLQRMEEFGNLYQNEILTRKEIQKLVKLIMKEHEPLISNVLDYYGIAQEELLLGVQCPNCSDYPMFRKSGKWHCSSCSAQDKFAHQQALEDYCLLINTTIKNQECRQFLLLNSSSIASKLLNASTNLKSAGTRKSAKYHFII